MNTNEHSSRWAAFLFSALLILLVLATVYVFVSGKYAPPAAITEAGRAIDHQYHLTLAVTAVVFVLSQLGLAFVVFRYRDHGQKVQFSHDNNTLEFLWTGLTAILFIGLGLLGGKAWANGRIRSDNGNPLGLDSADPAGTDDIVVPTLTVPTNQEIELLLRSQDVIHSFFVRELRLQQDAVPGLIVPLRFKADKIGHYEIVCTQLCGLGHSNMHSYLDVVSQANFDAFLKNGGQ